MSLYVLYDLTCTDSSLQRRSCRCCCEQRETSSRCANCFDRHATTRCHTAITNNTGQRRDETSFYLMD